MQAQLPTVQYPREIHLMFGSSSLFPRYLKFTAVRESAEHNVPQSVIATASDNSVVGYAIGKGISFSSELTSVSYPHCLSTNNDKGYGGIGCINFACTRVKAARVVVITAVTDYAT